MLREVDFRYRPLYTFLPDPLNGKFG
jgi:hypothetical protein